MTRFTADDDGRSLRQTRILHHCYHLCRERFWLPVKSRPHQQQCRSNVWLCCQKPKTATMSNEFIVKFRPFDKVECCFDIVAVFGNNIEQNFVISTKSIQIEHVQFVSTFSKGRNFVRRCCQNRQQCRSNLRLCRKNRSTCSIRQCCFDIVASVDGALYSSIDGQRNATTDAGK